MATQKRNRIAGWMALGGGCFMIIQGIRHFPMAFDVAKAQAFAALSPNASDFLIMCVLCIGVLLLALGVWSLYLIRKLKAGDPTARFFFLSLGVLFLLRTMIELKYPVSVPSPNHLVLVIVSAESLLFFMTAGLVKQEKT